MSRKIFITEKQCEDIKRVITEGLFPNNSLYSKYEDNSFESELEEDRFKKVESTVKQLLGSSFKDDIKYLKSISSEILSKCISFESNNRASLEKLCSDKMLEFFGDFVDDVELNCNLTNYIDNRNISVHISNVSNYDFENQTEVEYVKNEIEKRKLLSAIIIGASIVLSKFLLKRSKQELNEINDEIYDNYRKYVWINEYLLFKENVSVSDGEPNQAGGVDVMLGDDTKKTVIKSNALIYPVLLYETLKGFFELFITHGLPSKRKIAEYVLSKADKLLYEQHAMKIGPIIWDRIMKSAENLDSEILPYYLMEISKLELLTILNDICIPTKEGKKILEKILSDIHYNMDYSDFEDRLNNKRNDNKSLVTDDEFFSADELIDDNYI